MNVDRTRSDLRAGGKCFANAHKSAVGETAVKAIHACVRISATNALGVGMTKIDRETGTLPHHRLPIALGRQTDRTNGHSWPRKHTCNRNSSVVRPRVRTADCTGYCSAIGPVY